MKKLYRTNEDRSLGGVCAGVAKYMEIDPMIVRLVWVIFSFLLGFGIYFYIAAWLIIPMDPSEKCVCNNCNCEDTYGKPTPPPSQIIKEGKDPKPTV